MMKILYHVIFSKNGWMRYISHLDLLRLFNRALRRTGLKFYLTKGFRPRPVVRINKALKLGIESDKEEMEFVLDENVNPLAVKERLNSQLPEGVRITHVE